MTRPKRTHDGAETSTQVGWPRYGGEFQVRVLHSIHDVDAAQWDSLVVPDDLQASHRFVRACQEADIENAEYWHILVSDEQGVAATCTLSRFVVAMDACTAGMTRAAINMIRRAYHKFLTLPILFCGLPVSFGQSCLRFRGGARVPQLVELLAAVVDSIARQTRTSLICFKEFDVLQMQDLAALGRLGYLTVPSLPSCSLTLRWRSFEEYLASLRSGYRRQIRRSLQQARENALTVRILDDLRGHTDAIFALYEQVIDRAAHRLERLNAAFFENLARYLPGEYRLILVERAGRQLGFAIVLRSSAVATFLLAGLDYLPNRQYQVYQNLVIEVIREAIASGAHRLELGQTSYALKSRMGAEPTPRHLFLRHRRAPIHSLYRLGSRFLYPETDYPCRHVFRTETPRTAESEHDSHD